MDLLGVNKFMMKSSKHNNKRYNKKEIKVTYISSPMKVKTSASNFRALVQELTGLDSNVAETFCIEESDNNGVENNVQSVNRVSAQQWSLGADEGFVAEDDSCWKPDYDIEDHQLHSRSFMGVPLNQHLQCHDLFSIDFSL